MTTCRLSNCFRVRSLCREPTENNDIHMWTPSSTQEQREVGCGEGEEVNCFVLFRRWCGETPWYGKFGCDSVWKGAYIRFYLTLYLSAETDKNPRSFNFRRHQFETSCHPPELHHPNQLYALDLHCKSTIVHVEGIPSPPHHLPTRYSTHSLHASTALTPYPLATPSASSRTLRVRANVHAQRNAALEPAHYAPSKSSARADAERGRRA